MQRRISLLLSVFALLTSSCTVWTFGNNTSGQLGLGDVGPHRTPTLLDSVPQGGWTSVDAGYQHGCGLRTGGSLWCWGDNSEGQLGDGTTTDRPSADVAVPGEWTRVSTGFSHSCGIRSGGTLWCWGSNWAGQLGDGTTATRTAPVQVIVGTNWSEVTAGSSHTCALAAGAAQGGRFLFCWGDNSLGQLGLGDTTSRSFPVLVDEGRWLEVVGGDSHTCGLRAASGIGSAAWCWGNNGAGQVGVSPIGTVETTPVPVTTSSGATRWETLAVGAAHTCGIEAEGGLSDGGLWCWGDNSRGQLGNGGAGSGATPVQAGSDGGWNALDVGLMHSCASRNATELWCWGENDSGQLGDGSTALRASPVQIGADVGPWNGSIATGGNHTCAVTGQSTWCWGDGGAGQLAEGVRIDRTAPVPVEGDWTDVDAGGEHTCRIRSDATLWCWGQSHDGQLGIGDVEAIEDDYLDFPAQVGDEAWSRVSAGEQRTCAIRIDGTLWCWGSNPRGLLGVGSAVSPIELPLQVGADNDWTAISTTAATACAIKTNQTLWCWGENFAGQVGDGTSTDRTAPAQVGTDTDWRTVASGRSHTCGVRTDDSLWCWGINESGQLGVPGGLDQRTPLEIDPTSTWSTVTAGAAHTCAMKTDTTLWCWGSDSQGQLGTGSGSVATPTQVGDDGGWSVISAGSTHTCAVRLSSLSLWCWGNNSNGQIGDGTTIDRATPTQVGLGENWIDVSAGGAHTAATAL